MLCPIRLLIVLTTGWLALLSVASPVMASEQIDPNRFEKRILVQRAFDPMQLELLPDGSFLFIERGGLIKRYDARSGKVKQIGRAPSVQFGEVGLMGIKLDPDFISNGSIFLFFCPQDQKDHLRLSRFKIRDESLDMRSETVLLEYPIDPEGATHMGGEKSMRVRQSFFFDDRDLCRYLPREGETNSTTRRIECLTEAPRLVSFASCML